MDGPADDELELSFFGPGFGECAVIHVGSGNWIIIDSCIDHDTGEPVALQYLAHLGVDTGTQVKLIVATHWHDDHIRGMAKVFEACTSGKFCASAALSLNEFVATIAPYDQRHNLKANAGVREIFEVMRVAGESGRPIIRALPNRLVLRIGASELAHGTECRLTTLSPSDQQFDMALRDIGSATVVPGIALHRIPSPSPNHLSIATWLSVGDQAILMGADVEELGKKDFGWSAILAMEERPPGKASIFKIPHHGSRNGHHDGVWKALLHPTPQSVLTPWALAGNFLPQPTDVQRICGYSPGAHSTSSTRIGSPSNRSKFVQKQIRTSGVKLNRAEPRTGHVRFRNKGAGAMGEWEVECFNGARPLNEIYG